MDFKNTTPVNKNGLTFFQWYKAANLIGSAPNLPECQKAWSSGVDPTEYAVNPERV